MKKIYLLIFILLLTFTVFLIILLKPRDYKIEYHISNLLVQEQFIKSNNSYLFIINYKDRQYPVVIQSNYLRKRKLIKEISLMEKDSEVCLKSNILQETYYICSEDNTLKTIDTMSKDFNEEYNLNNKKEQLLDSYKNIKIYDKNKNILIWNYKGFYNLSNKDELSIFKADNYQNKLSYQTERYLIFPNYDQKYFFTKMYIYDIETKSLSNIDFEFEISYDSYYLGTYKNKLYLIDKKNKAEYEIDINKNTISLISKDNVAKYYNGSSWQELSLTKLINNELTFIRNEVYNFILDNEKLYLKINDEKVLLTNQTVKQIVYVNKDTVYYLCKDKLYSYNYLTGEKMLLQYSELNFNYNNHIFVFD